MMMSRCLARGLQPVERLERSVLQRPRQQIPFRPRPEKCPMKAWSLRVRPRLPSPPSSKRAANARPPMITRSREMTANATLQSMVTRSLRQNRRVSARQRRKQTPRAAQTIRSQARPASKSVVAARRRTLARSRMPARRVMMRRKRASRADGGQHARQPQTSGRP